LPLLGELEVLGRIVDARCLWQTGEHRGLSQVQFPGELIEVRLGGGVDPIGAIAVIDVVQVHHENLLLGIALGEADRHDRFADLAAIGALGADRFGVEHPDELLRDRRGAAGRLAAEIEDEAAHDRARLDAGIRPEGFVLGGDRRVDDPGTMRLRRIVLLLLDVIHQLFIADRGAPAGRRVGHLGQENPVAVVDFRRLEVERLEPIGRRQISSQGRPAEIPGSRDDAHPGEREEQQCQSGDRREASQECGDRLPSTRAPALGDDDRHGSPGSTVPSSVTVSSSVTPIRHER